jgi:hypothetical protein
MPIYEYRCPVHGKFEQINPVDTGRTTCPSPCDYAGGHSKGKKTKCGLSSKKVDFSVPASRNPDFGIQK